MNVCNLIEIITPKKVQLFGLLFGSKKAKRAYVFIHGLGGDMFGKTELFDLLLEKSSSVFAFNNRGHNTLTRVCKTSKSKKKKEWIPGGMAHEIFTDCVDDINGAVNTVFGLGCKEIILVGHSTGCQKSLYYASKKPHKAVKGIVLLAPISDYSSALYFSKRQLQKATTKALALVKNGKPQELLPASLWECPIDAQRFISAYTPDTAEDAFPYAFPEKEAGTFSRNSLPILALLAENDEYSDLVASKICDWMSLQKNTTAFVIPKAAHSFAEEEKEVVHHIKKWVNKL